MQYTVHGMWKSMAKYNNKVQPYNAHIVYSVHVVFIKCPCMPLLHWTIHAAPITVPVLVFATKPLYHIIYITVHSLSVPITESATIPSYQCQKHSLHYSASLSVPITEPNTEPLYLCQLHTTASLSVPITELATTSSYLCRPQYLLKSAYLIVLWLHNSVNYNCPISLPTTVTP